MNAYYINDFCSIEAFIFFPTDVRLITKYITFSHIFCVSSHQFISLFPTYIDRCVMADPFDIQGPSFTIEPPHHLEFTNIIDNHIDCVAKGSPPPKIEWLYLDNTPVTTIPRVSIITKKNCSHYVIHHIPSENRNCSGFSNQIERIQLEHILIDNRINKIDSILRKWLHIKYEWKSHESDISIRQHSHHTNTNFKYKIHLDSLKANRKSSSLHHTFCLLDSSKCMQIH